MIPPAKSRRPNRSLSVLLCALLLSAQLQTLKAEPPNETVQQLPSIDLTLLRGLAAKNAYFRGSMARECAVLQGVSLQKGL